MNELKFINTQNLKFLHSARGVTAKLGNRKFVLGTLSIGKNSIEFSEDDYVNLSKTVLEFECSVRGYPRHPHKLLELVESDEIINDYAPFYKYVKEDTYNKWISKGKWQLGTVQLYRTIENTKQRDEFEGFSFINLNINNSIVSQVCNAGYNFLIFCGTKSKASEKHRKQFGERELYFPDIKSFAEKIQKQINAKRFFIQKIQYNSLKSYINRNPIVNSKIQVGNNILVPEYFEILYNNLIYTSLFVKPESFQEEEEVRIIFEMAKDHFKPYKFTNHEILKCVIPQ